jgi:hypothetical protein
MNQVRFYFLEISPELFAGIFACPRVEPPRPAEAVAPRSVPDANAFLLGLSSGDKSAAVESNLFGLL